ncbi:hypothetical protein AMECASPLE_027089, partial [Ameca splendens]
MNAAMFYSFLQKKTKLALPVDGSEDELGFSDEENEQLATQQGESEVDRDSENDEDYEPENEDRGDSKERRRSEDRGDSEGESAVTVYCPPPPQQEPKKAKGLVWKKSRSISPVPQWKGSLPQPTGMKSPIEYFRGLL